MMPDDRRHLTEVLASVTEVRLAYLFGSAARGAEGPLSDVDVAVWLDRGLSGADRFDLGLRVANLAARVIARDDIDVVVLNDASPLLRQEVVTTGERLVCTDRKEEVRFRVETLRAYVAAQRLLAVARPYLARHLRRGAARGQPGSSPGSSRTSS